MNRELIHYIEQEILPRYDHFDAAHRRDHADEVITRSLALAEHYDININMVYAIAAYHDTGLCEGRDTHHLVSGRIIREDKRLREWFDENQIETIAQAAEDHRASSGHEPRSIYGKIVAEADRLIMPEKVIRRTIQYTHNTPKTISPTTTRSSNTSVFANTCWKNIPTRATLSCGYPSRTMRLDWSNCASSSGTNG